MIVVKKMITKEQAEEKLNNESIFIEKNNLLLFSKFFS